MAISGVVLSSQGLERAASIGDGETAFTFVGDGWEVECTSFQAAVLSPRVSLLLEQDRTVNTFIVEIVSAGESGKRIFGFFEALMQGLSISPLRSDLPSLAAVAGSLGNRELLSQFIDAEGGITEANVCERLRKKTRFGCSVEREIEFAALHFHELNPEDLKGVDISVLEGIVSSEALCLSSEDSLLDFALSLGSRAESIVRYLQAEYLSCGKMAELLDWVSVSSRHQDPLIWSSLCRRLLVSGFSLVRCPMLRPKSREGIIAYLTTKHENVADLTSDSEFFRSGIMPGQWVCWDFREMRVRPTHYTIKTLCLKSWVVEGSLDGKSWTEIDRQTNNQDFKDRHLIPTASFAVSNPAECRFIRLTQTGENPEHKNDYLYLSAVEFFGTLSE
jgi:hypothetical protein